MLSETKALIQDYSQEFCTALLQQGLVIKFNIHIIPCLLLFPTSKNNIMAFANIESKGVAGLPVTDLFQLPIKAIDTVFQLGR